MMPASLLPMAFAEVTKSLSQRQSDVARVTLAKMGMLKIPIAIILFTIPGPKIEVIKMALRTAGNP